MTVATDLKTFELLSLSTLFIWKEERRNQREMSRMLSSGLLPKWSQQLGWAMLRPGARSYIQVTVQVTQDPDAWAIICLPGYMLATNWMGMGAGMPTQVLRFECSEAGSYLLCRTLPLHVVLCSCNQEPVS